MVCGDVNNASGCSTRIISEERVSFVRLVVDFFGDLVTNSFVSPFVRFFIRPFVIVSSGFPHRGSHNRSQRSPLGG